jgi:hypothetical protein
MPIEPVDPSKKIGGEGKEPSAKARSTANDKDANPEKTERFRQDLEKAKSDRAKAEISKMAEATRAEPKYTGKAYSDTGPRTGPTSGGGGGGGGMPKINRDITKNMKKGGKVSSASKRADGIAIRGKTRA